ncbi:MAG: RHS repeat-associated core domain-containing protein [Verrucomicrobiae bacterium]|nr:RHS repeat-associated core domain-containing protein [Verrucomicrobiae bacterium]
MKCERVRANQLTNVYVASAWRESMKYDAFGRKRVLQQHRWTGSAWLLTNEVRYVYDGMLVVQERHFQPQVSTNIPIKTISYTRGNDLSGSLQGAGGIGGLLARTDSSSIQHPASSPHAYYHADGNGNITALMNTNGAVVARYQYDPYGNLLGMASPLAEANTYRFSSKEWHANAGLYYYGFRYYEPNLQRWINQDPLGDTGSLPLMLAPSTSVAESGPDEASFEAWIAVNQNLYGAIRNNPVNLLDLFGLEVCLETHPVKLKLNHSKITIIPENQEKWKDDSRFKNNKTKDGRFYATIGAGPEGRLRLVSNVNRQTDIDRTNNNFSKKIHVPNKMTEDEFIQKLFDTDAKYKDDLRYWPIPSDPNEYNSNSYVSGLLSVVAENLPKQPPGTPGYTKPVPAKCFE